MSGAQVQDAMFHDELSALRLALAACEARENALREALACDGRVNGIAHEWRAGQWDDARENAWCCKCGVMAQDRVDRATALLSAPRDSAALRAMLERMACEAWRGGVEWEQCNAGRDGNATLTQSEVDAIVARILSGGAA